jgi:hypothetical protein
MYKKYAVPFAKKHFGKGVFPAQENVLFAVTLIDEAAQIKGVLLAAEEDGSIRNYIGLEGVPEREGVAILRRVSQQAQAALGYASEAPRPGRLELAPIRLSQTGQFMLGGSRAIHRHHEAPQGGVFALSVVQGMPDGSPRIAGVAVVGRPVARLLAESEPYTLEITRLAADGTPHVPSMLLGAVERAAAALGWRSLVTYTLPSEGGASLRAAGWLVDKETAGGGDWGRTDRPRTTKHPTESKVRWRKNLA